MRKFGGARAAYATIALAVEKGKKSGSKTLENPSA
jgi:hypothetical protein